MLETESRDKAVRSEPTEIRDALHVLHEPGEVFEIRALDGRLRLPLSGYFDDYKKAADATIAAEKSGPEGIYVTLNPVKPELLARANNRLIGTRRGSAAADKDITRLRWLLVDLDPVRPSGISSTDSEHRAALDKAHEIADWLANCGWPSPVFCDSGNGAHLLYMLDLPPGESELLSRVLTTLDMVFSSDLVKVDKSTFNASRIVKLYGTLARKGDATEDRPHRRSQLVARPERLQTVSKHHLAAIAEFMESNADAAQARAGDVSFDVRGALSLWGLEVLREDPYSGGLRLTLKICPFGDHRREGKSAVFINADGRLGFHCFSDDHANLHWRDLRQKYEGTPRGATSDSNAHLGEPAGQIATSIAWPEPIADAALYGLAGEFVRLVYPHTEADPAALLVHFLVLYGNLVGGGPYRLAGKQKHHLNEYALIIGETKRGRKGTALAEAQWPFEIGALDWFGARIMGGLSSGEGLIWQVRDPIIKRTPVKDKNRYTGEYQEYEDDPGVSDKRLMVVETEFSQPLKVMGREGNTLSEVLRKAWDSSNLAILSRNSPTRATAPHISIIGHTTPAELVSLLDSVSAANGFGNRFLFVCSRRSKFLPWGGSTIDVRMPELAGRVAACAAQARKIGEFQFDNASTALWNSEYRRLSEGGFGLVGALTGRAEAHVLRVTCIYAATDEGIDKPGGIVREVHLRAALALWDYCERSARYLFGERHGDPVADAIIEALSQRPDSMTRDEIGDLFAGHKKAAEIEACRGRLLRLGRIIVTREQTGGRPVERWRLRT